MHILPAGLWSVITPLQLSPTFRSKHRTAHRRLGRLFIFMSASMSFGLVPLVLSRGTMIVPKSVSQTVVSGVSSEGDAVGRGPSTCDCS